MLFPTSSRVIAAFAESIQSLKVLSSPPATRATPFLFGTHDGNFHCDEALALSLLSLHPQYQNNQFEVVRTRNVDYLKVMLNKIWLIFFEIFDLLRSIGL